MSGPSAAAAVGPVASPRGEARADAPRPAAEGSSAPEHMPGTVRVEGYGRGTRMGNGREGGGGEHVPGAASPSDPLRPLERPPPLAARPPALSPLVVERSESSGSPSHAGGDVAGRALAGEFSPSPSLATAPSPAPSAGRAPDSRRASVASLGGSMPSRRSSLAASIGEAVGERVVTEIVFVRNFVHAIAGLRTSASVSPGAGAGAGLTGEGTETASCGSSLSRESHEFQV
jgi:hypothetical protein